MKKSILTLAAFFLILTTFAAGPSEIVLKNFNATFNNPTEVTWYDSQDFHQAYFVQSGITTRVKYDKKGNFISAIRYYVEENLPIHIVNQLKKNYSKLKVYGVTEVTTNETVNYFVTLEDEKNWTLVQVLVTGETATLNKFRKA
jgi:hypothetical protein